MSSDTKYHPHVTTDQITAALQTRSHPFDQDANYTSASLTNLVGMNKCGIGVRYAKLEPHQRSVAPHYHLVEHEWLYIVSGSATLLHVDASLPLMVSAPPGSTGRYPFHRVSEGHIALKEEHMTLGPGDFVGWLGGARGAKCAHSLMGGDEGCEYLVGSSQAPREVVSYPKAGVTMYLEGNYGGSFYASDIPNLSPAEPTLQLEQAESDVQELNHSVMRKAEIEEGLKFRRHPLDPETELYHARITDRMGWKMSGLAVHYVRLPPGKASSPVHYHLQEHEWVFILKGSAVLVEVDATLPELSFDLSVEGGLKRSSSGSTNLKPTERKLGVGDFIGWQGGVMAAKHAHSVRAGDQGCEYLMGGSRTNVDCCVFPLYGKAFVSDDDYGGEESKFVEVPVFPHGKEIL